MDVIIIEVYFSHKSGYLNKTQSFIARQAFPEPNSTMGDGRIILFSEISQSPLLHMTRGRKKSHIYFPRNAFGRI